VPGRTWFDGRAQSGIFELSDEGLDHPPAAGQAVKILRARIDNKPSGSAEDNLPVAQSEKPTGRC